MINKNKLYFCLFAIIILVSSCSNGPSNDIIEEKVSRYFRDEQNFREIFFGVNDDNRYAGLVNYPEKVKSITSIEILQKGELQKDGTYQKVRVNVKGVVETSKDVRVDERQYGQSYESDAVLNFKTVKTPDESFNMDLEFNFNKNSFGEWK